MKLSALKQDRATVEAGKWVSDIPNAGALRLRVRGLSSAVFVATRERLFRAAPRSDRLRDGNTLKPEAQNALVGQALAEAILLDWAGLTDDDGEPIQYSRDLAVSYLTDPDFQPFREAVAYAANVVDNEREDAVSVIEGN